MKFRGASSLLAVATAVSRLSLEASADSHATPAPERSTTPNDDPLFHRGSTGQGDNDSISQQVAAGEEPTWWENYRHQQRSLQSTSCPTPDVFTNLDPIRTGQYSSNTGDCFYIYWDPSKCTFANKCPLYVYVDGTSNAQDIDDRDYEFMAQMASRGYIAVTADYADDVGGYTGGCSSFNEKSRKIFDGDVVGSVLHQLCRDTDNLFDHGPNVPVDCELGVAVNGWSQGAHVAALAGNKSPLVTGALLFGNGNYNYACFAGYPTCSLCVGTDVSCVNDDNLALPKEKRRSIIGDEDTFFGACDGWFGSNNRGNVVNQQRATSGYDVALSGLKYCPVNRDDCMNRLPEGCEITYGTGEQTCTDSTNDNFGRQYGGTCSQCDGESPCGALYSGACPAITEPEQAGGYYVIPGKAHNFMDVSSGSDFMNPNVMWSLPANLDWLAQVARVEVVTPSPTSNPTSAPTDAPSPAVTAPPTGNPTSSPTGIPTSQPSRSPTDAPSPAVTAPPTDNPTSSPTGIPTSQPSRSPTGAPSPAVTAPPTGNPTSSPTGIPTSQPSRSPTDAPSPAVTAPPTDNPTSSPTGIPTSQPSRSPTAAPTNSFAGVCSDGSGSCSVSDLSQCTCSNRRRSLLNGNDTESTNLVEDGSKNKDQYMRMLPKKKVTPAPTPPPVPATNSPTTSPVLFACSCIFPTPNPTASPTKLAPPCDCSGQKKRCKSRCGGTCRWDRNQKSCISVE